MKKVLTTKLTGIAVIISVMTVMNVACGGSSSGTAAPTATTAPPAQATAVPPSVSPTAPPTSARPTTPAPAPTAAPPAAPTAAATAVPTAAPTATPVPTAATPVPTATQPPTPEPTPTPALLTTFSEFGFILKLDRGADVESAGWTEAEPSAAQGLIALNFGGVNTNLVWGASENRTPIEFVASTYNLLRAAQPGITFETISEGDVIVNEQTGLFGGFRALDSGGSAVGGGLIGAWVCPSGDTAFRLTMTGDDATVVQLRFDRLLENFTCSS